MIKDLLEGKKVRESILSEAEDFASTFSDDNIVTTKDTLFRYVNHSKKLLSYGYGTKQMLTLNKDTIKFDPSSIEIMKTMYSKFYDDNGEMK